MHNETTYQTKPSHSAKVKSNPESVPHDIRFMFFVYFSTLRVYSESIRQIVEFHSQHTKMRHTRTAYVNSFPYWTDDPLHTHCQGWHLVCWCLLISDGTTLGSNDHAKPHYLRLYLFFIVPFYWMHSFPAHICYPWPRFGVRFFQWKCN